MSRHIVAGGRFLQIGLEENSVQYPCYDLVKEAFDKFLMWGISHLGLMIISPPTNQWVSFIECTLLFYCIRKEPQKKLT